MCPLDLVLLSYKIFTGDKIMNLRAHECLTPEKERELAILAANGNRNAKDELILSNIKFVVSFSKKFLGYGLSHEELIEEGLIGLCQAVEHFNPNKGARLTTYASFWIRNAILDGINESGTRIRLSGEKARLVIKLKKALAEAKTLFYDDKDCLVYACNVCNCSLEEAENLLILSQQSCSLDAPTKNDEDYCLAKQIPDFRYSSTEDNYVKHEMENNLQLAMKKLKPDEQEVLKLHYGLAGNEPEPFSSIATKIGKSRARVHQIEKIAMERLQCELKASGY